MKPKILVTREVFDETLAFLAQHCEVESNQQDTAFDPDTLARKLADKDGLVCALTDRVDAKAVRRGRRPLEGGGEHRRRLQQPRRRGVERARHHGRGHDRLFALLVVREGGEPTPLRRHGGSGRQHRRVRRGRCAAAPGGVGPRLERGRLPSSSSGPRCWCWVPAP